MSEFVANELRWRGSAQVVVILRDPPPTPEGITLKNKIGAALLAARAFEPCGVGDPLFLEPRALGLTSSAMEDKSCPTDPLSKLEAATLEFGRTRSLVSAASAQRLGADLAAALGGLSNIEQLRPWRFFEHLNVLLGDIGPKDYHAVLEEQKAANSNIEAVIGLPEFRLARPFADRRAKGRTRSSWNLDAMGIPAAWRQGATGAGARVGLVGGWPDTSHRALHEAISRVSATDVLGRLVPESRPNGYDRATTLAAGTIAGRWARGRAIGVAPGAEIASFVIPGWGNTPAQVLAALDWAVAERLRVLYLPLESPGYLDELRALIGRVRKRGVLPIAPIGDDGAGSSGMPGNVPGVLSVGSVDRRNDVTLRSSSQQLWSGEEQGELVPVVVAPGHEVLSCALGGRYAIASGTIMAAAHVAGLAALLFGAEPYVTVEQVEAAIVESCLPLPPASGSRAQYGIPSAPAALDRLRQGFER